MWCSADVWFLTFPSSFSAVSLLNPDLHHFPFRFRFRRCVPYITRGSPRSCHSTFQKENRSQAFKPNSIDFRDWEEARPQTWNSTPCLKGSSFPFQKGRFIKWLSSRSIIGSSPPSPHTFYIEIVSFSSLVPAVRKACPRRATKTRFSECLGLVRDEEIATPRDRARKWVSAKGKGATNRNVE